MSAARLVPELYCSDIRRSTAFYVDLLGFSVRFARPEDRFVYLEREGAEIMLEQPTGRTFLTAQLEHPYGRGINFQIEVADVQSLYVRVKQAAWPVFLELEDRWYRQEDRALGNRQFVIQDPDGYLLRFFEDLGSRVYQAAAGEGSLAPTA
jgi:catechol 2,3-dioxygenase-like lactoylglutathione lyase family enzyme